MDQKKLRELMKKEKDQRQASSRGVAQPASGVGRVGEAAGVVNRPQHVAAPQRGRGAPPPDARIRQVPAAPASTAKEAAGGACADAHLGGFGVDIGGSANANLPMASGALGGASGLLGSYGDDSAAEEESQPPDKMRRLESVAVRTVPPSPMSQPGALLSREGRWGNDDAAALPPPQSQEYCAKCTGGKEVGGQHSLVESVLPEGFFDDPEEDARARGQEDQQKASSRGRARDLEQPSAALGPGPEGGEEVGGHPSLVESVLPEGFFDDPEEDARARGKEAPAIKKQRELEEGLKKFEKEMMIETEIAEETRNDLDEARYAEVAEEEEEFQTDLAKRLEVLRARREERQPGQSEQTVNNSPPSEEDGDRDADGEDGDSDFNFDWRAKGFS